MNTRGATVEERREVEQLFTVDSLAAYLGVTERKIRELLGSGTLRGFKPAGNRGGWRIRASEVDRFIREEEEATAQERRRDEAYEQALDAHYAQWSAERWGQVTAGLEGRHQTWLAEQRPADENERDLLEDRWQDIRQDLEQDAHDELEAQWREEEDEFRANWVDQDA
jgi:excisionase family DNA binding protein